MAHEIDTKFDVVVSRRERETEARRATTCITGSRIITHMMDTGTIRGGNSLLPNSAGGRSARRICSTFWPLIGKRTGISRKAERNRRNVRRRIGRISCIFE